MKDQCKCPNNFLDFHGVGKKESTKQTGERDKRHYVTPKTIGHESSFCINKGPIELLENSL